jgi:hypothetical protein
MRVVVRTSKRLVRTGEHRNVGIADFSGQQRVLGRLLKANVPATVVRPRTRTLGSATP